MASSGCGTMDRPWWRSRASGWWRTAPSTIPRREESEEARARRAAAGSAASRWWISKVRWSCCWIIPDIASKRWVYEQYDSTVQAATVLPPGSDAGVIRVPGTEFGLAMTVDCNCPAGCARSL